MLSQIRYSCEIQMKTLFLVINISQTFINSNVESAYELKYNCSQVSRLCSNDTLLKFSRSPYLDDHCNSWSSSLKKKKKSIFVSLQNRVLIREHSYLDHRYHVGLAFIP